MRRAAGFLAGSGERLVVESLRVAIFGGGKQGQEIAGGRRADVGSVDGLLGIANDIGSCRDVLIPEVGRFSCVLSNANELTGRERIKDLAARLGIRGNRPLF